MFTGSWAAEVVLCDLQKVTKQVLGVSYESFSFGQENLPQL